MNSDQGYSSVYVNKYVFKRDLNDESDGAHLTSFGFISVYKIYKIYIIIATITITLLTITEWVGFSTSYLRLFLYLLYILTPYLIRFCLLQLCILTPSTSHYLLTQLFYFSCPLFFPSCFCKQFSLCLI